MKPGSFTQIYIQLIFSPLKRECLIRNEHKDELYKYIKNQEVHHQKITFRKEYTSFLKKFEIDYEEQFLFQFFD